MKARVRSALEELPEDSPNRGRLNEMLENLEDLHDQVADSSANVESINNTMGEAARLEAEIPQAAGRNPTAASGGPGEGQAPTEGGTPKEGGSGSEPEGTPEGESPREGEPKTGEGEPTEGEPTTPASPVARMLRRIADLKRRAHDALRRVEELTPDSNPDKWGWRARASELRQTLRELDTVAERSTPEELGELVEPEVQTAEGQLSDLENELPRGPLENTEAAPPEPSQPSAPEPTIDQNVPVARQLEGQGQLRDLRSSPNIPEGVDLEGLLQRTPAELEQMVARGELDARVYRQIMKAFEGRDLAGRSGNR
jgi:hypothetical protein